MSAVQKGGARKKIKVGRPAEVSCQSAIRHVQSIAPPSFVPDARNQTYTAGDSPVTISDLECPICMDRPILLVTCGCHICIDRCCEWLKEISTLSCPCYYGNHFSSFSTIRPGSILILKLVGGLQTVCRECDRVVKVSADRTHSCNSSPASPPQVRVQDVLQRPLNAPLTPVEKKLQANLAMRSLVVSPEDILKIKTNGQVY